MTGYPKGVTDADIAGALADEDFYVDFTQRFLARSPLRRGARILRDRMRQDQDPDLEEGAVLLEQEADKRWREYANPRRKRKRGVHIGQAEAALCRELLVLSVHAERGQRGPSAETLLRTHNAATGSWTDWNKKVPATIKAEVRRTRLLPAKYGMRDPIPPKLWSAYVLHVPIFSRRPGRKGG